MKNGQKITLKAMVLLLTAGLLIGGTVGGTLAYLKTRTTSVVNTFTAGNINITLTETWNTDTDDDDVNDSWSGKMIPGGTIAKDPVVTVANGSEDCWLFVKIENSNPTYITYEIGDNWITTTTEGVYYIEVQEVTTDKKYSVIKNNIVTVPDSVTKEMMDAVNRGDVTPKLTITAYAVQKEAAETVVDAWAIAEQLPAPQ